MIDLKTKKYIEEVALINKDKPWSYENTIFNSNSRIKFTCSLHGEFESYYDSVKKGMGCRKCTYLRKDINKYKAELESKNINLDELYENNIIIANRYDISSNIKNSKPKEIIMSILCKPIVKGDAVEKPVPSEMLQQKYYKEIETDEIAHFYKCALARIATYKNKEYREQYKSLSETLKKVLDARRSESKKSEVENEAE